MKKLIALVMALVMALSLTTVAWGAAYTTLASMPVDAATPYAGSTREAYAPVDDITLSANETLAKPIYVGNGVDITISAADPATPVEITTSVIDAIHVAAGGKLTLGAGVTIKSTAGAVLWADGGAITIAGTAITSSGTQTVAYVSGTGSLTVNSGSLTATGAAKVICLDGANTSATVNGGTVAATHNDSNYETVQVLGGTCTVDGGTVSSVACSAIAMDTQGGIINIKKGTVSTTAAHPFAAAFGYAGTINVTGGTMTASNSIAVVASNTATANVSGGNVQSVGVVNAGGTVNVTGGEFAVAPSQDYLPTGMTTIQTTDGTYVLGTVPAMGDKFDLYLADAGMNTALKLKTPAVAGLSFDEVAAKTNKDGSGRVAYIAANNGQYFVKTTNPTVADYAVTDAGKTTVLYYVTVAGTSAANFEYVESVTAFNKFSTYDKCGYVTGTPVAGETYFVASDDLVYMAAAAGTGTNYLLNGKVVSGINAGAAETHTFTLNGYKYDATLKTNVPTSAICTKCMMTTGSIYLNTKVPATYTLYPTTGEGSANYVVALPSASAVVTPSTPAGDKVQSAETFDAGIAMYVGMSIMAATGAVVLKKKD